MRTCTPDIGVPMHDVPWFSRFEEIFPAPINPDEALVAVANNLGTTVDVITRIEARLTNNLFEVSPKEINRIFSFPVLNDIKAEIQASYDGTIYGDDVKIPAENKPSKPSQNTAKPIHDTKPTNVVVGHDDDARRNVGHHSKRDDKSKEQRFAKGVERITGQVQKPGRSKPVDAPKLDLRNEKRASTNSQGVDRVDNQQREGRSNGPRVSTPRAGKAARVDRGGARPHSSGTGPETTVINVVPGADGIVEPKVVNNTNTTRVRENPVKQPKVKRPNKKSAKPSSQPQPQLDSTNTLPVVVEEEYYDAPETTTQPPPEISQPN